MVLLDIRMPDVDGLTVLRQLRTMPDAPVVAMLTTFDTDEYILTALHSGAAGFLAARARARPRARHPAVLAAAAHVRPRGDRVRRDLVPLLPPRTPGVSAQRRHQTGEAHPMRPGRGGSSPHPTPAGTAHESSCHWATPRPPPVIRTTGRSPPAPQEKLPPPDRRPRRHHRRSLGPYQRRSVQIPGAPVLGSLVRPGHLTPRQTMNSRITVFRNTAVPADREQREPGVGQVRGTPRSSARTGRRRRTSRRTCGRPGCAAAPCGRTGRRASGSPASGRRCRGSTV